MEDPRFKGTELMPVYEDQQPMPPPKILYYMSRQDGTRYNEDGSEYTEPMPELAMDVPGAPPEPEVSDADAETLKADEKAADEYGKAQTTRKKK